MYSILIARTSRRRSPQSSFTLVEMLVSLAVFTILVLLVTGVLGQLNRMWVQTEAQNQRERSGRGLLNFLARDIRKAMLPFPASSSTSLDFVINPTAIGSPASAYNYHDSIFFQAPIATDSIATSVGEVAEVGYFVQWQPASGSQVQTAQLCRFFVNPTDTTDFLIYANPAAWLSTANLTDVASGGSPNYAGLLAENVIGLWINPYDKNGNPYFTSTSRIYDSRNPPNPPDTAGTPNLPAMVDISILVLDPATAKRLGSGGAASVSAVQTLVQSASITNADQCLSSLPAVLQPGASCFTTRVQLSNSQ